MSYDLYCYKSKIGRPDLGEAQTALEETDDANTDSNSSNFDLKEKLAKVLVDFNPKLERFIFDYNEIAKMQNITIEQARKTFQHIELTKAEGELAVQLTIYDGNVSITVPYWYSGEKAKAVFKEVSEYTKLIKQKAGYFVYDPQTENVYDPCVGEFDGLDIYERTTIETQKLSTQKTTTKPWWKFS